jgi:hypothetical protein
MKRLASSAIIALGLSKASALAADVAVLKAAPKASPPASWWDTVKFSCWLDAGVTFNPSNPSDGINFGHLFTDKANQPLLNQFVLTLERPLDPKATGYDFGFRFQGMYGSDARYTHFLGEFDHAISDRNQIDVVEAYVLAHLPWLTTGGVDVKMGQFVTLEGAETIDPRVAPGRRHLRRKHQTFDRCRTGAIVVESLRRARRVAAEEHPSSAAHPSDRQGGS